MSNASFFTYYSNTICSFVLALEHVWLEDYPTIFFFHIWIIREDMDHYFSCKEMTFAEFVVSS